MSVTWSKCDVPAVKTADLLGAVHMWLGEASRSPLALATVEGRKIGWENSLERRIADRWGGETDRSLAIILRLRCLQATLTCRRFQKDFKGGDEAWLCAAVAAAAGMRVNADIGFSPVRLAWAIAAKQEAGRTSDQHSAAA